MQSYKQWSLDEAEKESLLRTRLALPVFHLVALLLTTNPAISARIFYIYLTSTLNKRTKRYPWNAVKCLHYLSLFQEK